MTNDTREPRTTNLLELVAKHRMTIVQDAHDEVRVWAHTARVHCAVQKIENESDRLAATCLAIARVAAEIEHRRPPVVEIQVMPGGQGNVGMNWAPGYSDLAHRLCKIAVELSTEVKTAIDKDRAQ